MATNKLTTPKSIRNLQLLSPEGSVVAVWADKVKDDVFYLAVTTKVAGWGGFTQRKHLEGPMDGDAVLTRLVALKKRGEQALDTVSEYFAAQIHEETLAAQQDAPVTDALVNDLVIETPSPVVDAQVMIAAQPTNVEADPLFQQLLERAMTRTPERNEQLKVEVVAEIEKLGAKIAELSANAEATEGLAKAEFALHRKHLMVEALTVALAA